MALDHISEDELQAQYEEALEKLQKDDRPDCAKREDSEREITVKNDITGESRCTGTYNDFSRYFLSRYEQIKEILEERNVYGRSIDSLERQTGEEVTVVGMVKEVRTTQSDNRLITLEDTTGITRAVFTDKEEMEQTQHIVEDEVLAVEGQLSDNGEIIFGDSIIHPELPQTNKVSTADRAVRAVLISDTHFGSEEFDYQKWDYFVDWIRQQGDMEYLLVAGDLVEGIGVYPDQRDELEVEDIYDQYKLCAEAFRELPSDMDIISITGNHDSVRLEEPQPAIREDFKEFFDDNVTFVGNPSYVTLEGVTFLMYHGMSLNPLIGELPNKDIQNPEDVMVPLLEKRHLAPMYGDIRIAPEERDYLVVSDIPDVLHSGHVHTFGHTTYNDVQVLNTGTWQKQTDFQRAKNVDPDVGYASVVDLSTLNVRTYDF